MASLGNARAVIGSSMMSKLFLNIGRRYGYVLHPFATFKKYFLIGYNEGLNQSRLELTTKEMLLGGYEEGSRNNFFGDVKFD